MKQFGSIFDLKLSSLPYFQIQNSATSPHPHTKFQWKFFILDNDPVAYQKKRVQIVTCCFAIFTSRLPVNLVTFKL